MGLDSVELVLTVEEHFDIEIPDGIAEKIYTVEALHRFVVTQLERRRQMPVDRDAVFRELREIICEQLGIKPEKVVPGARFVQDLGMN